MADPTNNSVTSPADVGMATGPAPIPAAPSAIQPNPAAQSTQSTAQPGDNSNAPDASTPAAKSIPPALVNDPQVASQKAAAQVDANKNSVSPPHSLLYRKALEMIGGPHTQATVDANGQITRTPVQPKPWALGMALALDVLSGAMAGGSQKNTTDAFQAGQAKAKQQQDAVKQANLENDATARADQRYKLEITESNMRLYQAGVTAAKTSLEAAQAFGDNQKVITEPLLDGTIQLPPNASMERKSMDDTAASVANGQTNITKDILFAVGDAQPSRDRNGNQIVIDGKPQTKHDYLIIHGVGPDGKIPFTKAMQDECDKYGVKNIPAAGIGEPMWTFSDIAKSMAKVASLKNGEMILQMHHDDAHDMLPDHEAQDIDIAKAVKDNPEWNKAVDLLAQAQHSLPGANTHIEDILNVVGQKSVSAQGLLMNYLGLKAKDLDTLHNQRVQEETEAKTKEPQAKPLTAEEAANKIADTQLKKADTQLKLSAVAKNQVEVKKIQADTDKLLADKTNNDSIVDSMGTGHVAAPNLAYMLRSKEGQELIAKVTDKYPDFDSSKAGSYPKEYDDYTSQKKGSAGFAINSGGTAFQHLNELLDLNTAASHIPGTPAYTAYKNKMDTVVSELGQFYGNTTIPGLQDFKDTLSSTLPGNREAAIRTQAKSMGDKMNSYEHGWLNAAPSEFYQAPLPGLSPDALRARTRLDPAFKQRAPENAAGQAKLRDGKTYWVNKKMKPLQEVI